ncbi:MAG: hypothetical protein ACLVDZ_03140 [Ruminococcus sp.]
MRKYLTILAAFSLCIPVLPASAAEVSQVSTTVAQQGNVSILPTYDTDIEPQKEDVFQIQVRESLTGNVHDITIHNSSTEQVQLPFDTYTVEDIIYQGNNEEIEQSGYGILSKFDVTTQDREIPLAVGDEELEYLYYDYQNVTGKKNGEFVDFSEMQVSETTSEGDLSSEIGTTSIELTDTPVPEETPTVQPESSQKPDEDFGVDDMFAFTKDRNYFLAALPIIVLAIAGFGTIFLLHKKGKI